MGLSLDTLVIQLSQGNLHELLKLSIAAERNQIRIQLRDDNHLQVEYIKGSGGAGTRKSHRRILRLPDSRWVHFG